MPYYLEIKSTKCFMNQRYMELLKVLEYSETVFIGLIGN